jgi:hypothetical protein
MGQIVLPGTLVSRCLEEAMAKQLRQLQLTFERMREVSKAQQEPGDVQAPGVHHSYKELSDAHRDRH